MFSKSRECSIERACVKLRFPANRYVKHHMENRDTLDQLTKAYTIETRHNIRNNLAYHILSSFEAANIALEELGLKSGDRETNKFLAYMRSKKIQVTASNIIDTFFNLDSEQKKKKGIIERVVPRPRF